MSDRVFLQAILVMMVLFDFAFMIFGDQSPRYTTEVIICAVGIAICKTIEKKTPN